MNFRLEKLPYLGAIQRAGIVVLKCFFADVCIQLIGEDTHNSIGESAKSHGPEEKNNTGFEEKAADISTDNDPVKADVVEFDIS